MSGPHKLRALTSDEARTKVFELCQWIRGHARQPISWADLSQQSGLTHQELILLFKLYQRDTPMGYVRRCRAGVAPGLPLEPQEPPAPDPMH